MGVKKSKGALFYGLADTAAELGLPEDRVHQLVQDGELRPAISLDQKSRLWAKANLYKGGHFDFFARRMDDDGKVGLIEAAYSDQQIAVSGSSPEGEYLYMNLAGVVPSSDEPSLDDYPEEEVEEGQSVAPGAAGHSDDDGQRYYAEFVYVREQDCRGMGLNYHPVRIEDASGDQVSIKIGAGDYYGLEIQLGRDFPVLIPSEEVARYREGLPRGSSVKVSQTRQEQEEQLLYWVLIAVAKEKGFKLPEVGGHTSALGIALALLGEELGDQVLHGGKLAPGKLAKAIVGDKGIAREYNKLVSETTGFSESTVRSKFSSALGALPERKS